MKKFGLIGGVSWHSTIEYYVKISRIVNERFGDNTNPPLRIVNLNQKEIHDHQRRDDWQPIRDIFMAAALELQAIEVEGLAICSNTSHKTLSSFESQLSTPVLHIADAVGSRLRSCGYDQVGFLGTRFTMSERFITGRIEDPYGIRLLVPEAGDQEIIQDLVYRKLALGIFDDDSRSEFLRIIDSLAKAGAQAVVLGCTEFPLLLGSSSDSSPLPFIDSLQCHCEAIAEFILDAR